MRTDTAPAIFRHDYAQPAYWVETVDLGFDLVPSATRVAARTRLNRNPDSTKRAI